MFGPCNGSCCTVKSYFHAPCPPEGEPRLDIFCCIAQFSINPGLIIVKKVSMPTINTYSKNNIYKLNIPPLSSPFSESGARTHCHPRHHTHSLFNSSFINIKSRCVYPACNSFLLVTCAQPEKTSRNFMRVVGKIFCAHS